MNLYSFYAFLYQVALENEDTKRARLLAEQAANKPLYQQLAEKKQKEQEEYDANTKKIFAPPKVIAIFCLSITFLGFR